MSTSRFLDAAPPARSPTPPPAQNSRSWTAIVPDRARLSFPTRAITFTTNPVRFPRSPITHTASPPSPPRTPWYGALSSALHAPQLGRFVRAMFARHPARWAWPKSAPADRRSQALAYPMRAPRQVTAPSTLHTPHGHDMRAPCSKHPAYPVHRRNQHACAAAHDR